MNIKVSQLRIVGNNIYVDDESGCTLLRVSTNKVLKPQLSADHDAAFIDVINPSHVSINIPAKVLKISE